MPAYSEKQKPRPRNFTRYAALGRLPGRANNYGNECKTQEPFYGAAGVLSIFWPYPGHLPVACPPPEKRARPSFHGDIPPSPSPPSFLGNMRSGFRAGHMNKRKGRPASKLPPKVGSMSNARGAVYMDAPFSPAYRGISSLALPACVAAGCSRAATAPGPIPPRR